MTKKDEETMSSHVYLRDPDHIWIPAVQLQTQGGSATVSIPEFKAEQDMLSSGGNANQKFQRDNQVIELKDYPSQVLPMQNVDSNGRLEEYKDMVNLPFLHEVRICDRRRRSGQSSNASVLIHFHARALTLYQF